MYPFRECVHTSRRRRPHPRPCTASSLCHTGDIYQASDKGCIEPVGAGITPILYCIWPYRIHCTAYLLALALIRTHVLFSVGGSCGCEGKSTADTHTGYFTILAAPYWLHHTGYHTVLAITPYWHTAGRHLARCLRWPCGCCRRCSATGLRHTTPHQIAPHQTPRTQHNSYSGCAVDASSSSS